MSFSVDWNEWRSEWTAWRASAGLRRSATRFPDKNFLADEVLGVYRINGQDVELSEVTFPDLSGERRGEHKRYVGITYLGQNGELENGGLVDSFEALEEVLGLVNH